MKRIISLFLAMAMMLTVLPMSIFAADDYTATAAGNAQNSNPVRVGETIQVDFGTNQGFAAAELTISYDPALVTFVEEQTDAYSVKVDATNGTLKLAIYGEDKTADTKYVLKFTADAVGSAVFAVTDAGFGTGESAATANLTKAVSLGSVTVEIKAELLDVTLTGDGYYAENTEVEKGGEFTFYPEQTTGAYYDYETPVVTDGNNQLTVTTSQDGKGWTVTVPADAIGPITVAAADRAPKNYGAISYAGTGADGVTEPTANAVYKSDVTFTIPADKAPGLDQPGYEYTVTATINGQTYTFGAPTVDENGNRTYTIPGTEVKGAVAVTVTKTDLDPTKYTVHLGGNASGDGKYNGAEAGASIQVDKGGSATLTVDTTSGVNRGYIYEVTVGDQTLTLDENNQVTLEGITATTTININRKVNVTGAINVVELNGETKSFLSMDNNETMWLIQLPNHVQNTATARYTYNGQEMYWSADHNNYVIAVISQSAPSLDSSLFGLETTTATLQVASDNWDVNKSGTLDANDAQIIWNMYNTVYDGFDSNVPVDKFMLADANHDGVLDMADAAVVISKILG